MGCQNSKGRPGVAMNYEGVMTSHAYMMEQSSPGTISQYGSSPSVVQARPSRHGVVIDVSELPVDYRRLIKEVVYSDNVLDSEGRGMKCRCLLVQFKTPVALCGVAISTVSGTLWENVLMPRETRRPQGFAHLVEHLIYSKGGADAGGADAGGADAGGQGDIRQWFADRNGDTNACTTDSDMRMWFTVPPKFLMEALNKMLHSVYAREEYGGAGELEREMLSIDEEYRGMCTQYEVRVMSLLKKICHPTNPWFNTFTCGNSSTLSEKLFPNIRECCKDFHTNVLKQQDANIVIVSSFAASEILPQVMTACVRARMGKTKPTRSALNLKRSFPPAFTAAFDRADSRLPTGAAAGGATAGATGGATAGARKNIPSLLILNADEWKMEFRFVVPEFKKETMKMHAAMSFISHMFRQQNQGSFLSVLHNKGLAYGVSACRNFAGIGQNFFDIEFLIDENYRETDESASDASTDGAVWLRLMRRIGKALFAYLNVLASEFKRNVDGFTAWNEFQVIKELQYDGVQAPDAVSMANEIATRMSTIFRAPVATEELPHLVFDPPTNFSKLEMCAAVNELVTKHLRVDNAICVLAGPDFSTKQWPDYLSHRGSPLLDRQAVEAQAMLEPDRFAAGQAVILWEKDPWFGTKYCICDLSDRIKDHFYHQASASFAEASDVNANFPRMQRVSPKLVSPSVRAASTGIAKPPIGPDQQPTKLTHQGSIFGAECFDSAFVLDRPNEYIPEEKDLRPRKMESTFVANEESVRLVVFSDTLRRVGEKELPKNLQLFVHRHKLDTKSQVLVSVRFFLPCLQAQESELMKLHRQGTMTMVGDKWESSTFLARLLMGKVLLRCVANRLRGVSNQAAVAGVHFNIGLTSALSEGQVALELTMTGYSSESTRMLLRNIFLTLLTTTEGQLGNIPAALTEVKSTLSTSFNNTRYDARCQLTPNLGLVLIPANVPVPSQLKVLKSIEQANILKFLGVNTADWRVADMFQGASVMCIIGGNLTVKEAINDWTIPCLLKPLQERGIDLEASTALNESLQDNVERLPFHIPVLDLDNFTKLLPSMDTEGVLAVYGDVKATELKGTAQTVGHTFLYAYNNHDNGTNIVQMNISCKVEEDCVGALLVVLKTIEQEYFSWIRDVHNLAYYLSVSFKSVGLDGNVLSFAVCSTTAPAKELLLRSVEILEAPRFPGERDAPSKESLSEIWHNASAFNDLRDSVVFMLRQDNEVETLSARHRVLIEGVFSGAHDFDANMRIADKLEQTSHADFLRTARPILRCRSRYVQMSCDPKTAKDYACSEASYDTGAPKFGKSEALSSLIALCRAIDGRTWIRLSDPRTLHRLAYAGTKTEDADSAKFIRKPRAYRRGTVSVTRDPAPRSYGKP